MAVSMRRREERLRRMLLERSREYEVRIRKELKNRVQEGPHFFSASARDEGDLSSIVHEQDLNCRRISACSENLKHVAEALKRLRQASYGTCEECGAEISEKRLQVVPFTGYCLECQEALEAARISQKINEWVDRKTPAGDQ